MDVFSEIPFSANPASIIATFVHKGFGYKYTGFDLDKMKLEPGKWNSVTFDYLTPEVRRPDDLLKVYLWHRGKKSLWMDNLKVVAYIPKSFH